MKDSNSSQTILETLSKRSIDQPTKIAWNFLDDKGEIVDQYSYLELEAATDYLASHLLSYEGLKKGDRILLVFFPGLDFTVSLLACFKANLIAVPVFPPDPRKLKKDLHHFLSIQSSSGANFVLTNSQYSFVKKVEDLKNIFSNGRWPDLKWIIVDEFLKKGKSQKINTKKEFPPEEQLAFLQYTSGSTSEPKGVMISHMNLAHNLSLIIDELQADLSTINVSWLPQYHDMGLIGSYLGVLYCGGTGYYLSPISFLKNPMIWIKVMSKYRATHTQAPNFAYALVTRKFKENYSKNEKLKSEFNLSSLYHMINAAEPVDYVAIKEFYEYFSICGLRSNVVVPTYGLAEHTVFVCSGGKQVLEVSKASIERDNVEIIREEVLEYHSENIGQDHSISFQNQRIVGCGYPGHAKDVLLYIVDTESSKVLRDLEIGEIWICSPSKARGYWNLTDLSLHDFNAQIAGTIVPSEKNHFLRTGDLGFLYKGELFICGRLKDLIIIGGSNHYPQDIERSIESSLSNHIRAGCSAAFSIQFQDNNKPEEIVYIAEIKDGVTKVDFPDIVKKCREIAANEHGIGINTICLLETRSVPKTTSGKIARSWCRKGLQQGSLKILYRSDELTINQKDFLDIDRNEVQTSGKYEKLPTGEPGAMNQSTTLQNMHFSAENVREMKLEDIAKYLETALVQISAIGPNQLKAPIPTTSPLVGLGLDSMTIVQFHGVVENKFHTTLPEEFYFGTMATLEELTIAVKNGNLTADQTVKFDNLKSNIAHSGEQNQNKQIATAPVVMTKQPCCPWFFCCY